ncbi:MAG: DNA topoisomerase (ATP-hydrolyzing) subunit A [Microcystaceae cyanobacterium]
MAKQLKLLSSGQIIPTALHQEMSRSYLEYAMSVIVGRALPDVRDGLKPVHRRILYAMYELGLSPDRPFRKCARVVGDVLGKYHPHGDQSVYDALVRMVQDFSCRYPLLAGHGNFGSIDNDPPAAMRYTETRLNALSFEGMLGDISEAIVDFTNNFDNSQQEPVVLPAQLPILLLNGCAGIAVGMATNVPPHNLSELVDGLIALIDKPDLADEKLWEIIPGPDFPTGGEILDTKGIKDAYRTGKGSIPIRGVTKRETLILEGRRPRERKAIVVTELPYQVNKAGWIEKVADLVTQGKIEGIADIRDESDRTGMRVVIELKRDTTQKKVLDQLYKKTALQTNFGAIFLSLVDNKPCQLSLKETLQEFLNFREDTLTRHYTNDLEVSRQRIHLVQGLLIALNHLDQVIDILRHAADGSTAKVQLIEQLDITNAQADSILAMPLRRLTGLEKQKLEEEFSELQQSIEQLEILLNDRHELMKSLKKELRSLKRKFGDERRTRILTPKPDKSAPKNPNQEAKDAKKKEASQGEKRASQGKNEVRSLKKADKAATSEAKPLNLFTPQPPPENAILTVTREGYVYWEALDAMSQVKPKTGEDYPIYRALIKKQEQFIVVTDHGKAYPIPCQEVPPKDSQPIHLMGLLPSSGQRDANKIISQFFLPKPEQDLLLLTEAGKTKRLASTELSELTNRGLVLIKLKEEDKLHSLNLTQTGEHLIIAISSGRILRLLVDDPDVSLMGRNAQGNQGIKLRYGETIVGCVNGRKLYHLILITQYGYGKQIPLNVFRRGKLGDLGTPALQFKQKEDQLALITLAETDKTLILPTSQQRRLTVEVDTINEFGKDGTGDRIVSLQSGEKILKD